MPKILHTARYSGLPLEILQRACPVGLTVKTLDELSYQQLLKEAPDADYFLVSGRLPIDKTVLDAAKNLKMIQRTGVGTDMLDKEEIKKRGIPVYVNAGVNSRSVAEHTLMLILATLKRLPQINEQVHKGIWKKQVSGVSTSELFGKTIGIVGMGHVGQLVASMLRPFGVHVIYTDIVRRSETEETELGLTYCDSFMELLPQVDILTLHCPMVTENLEALNSNTIGMMKQGSIIINTARGKLINPDALYDAIISGHIKAAGIDTHYEEPIEEGYKLAKLDNVILTPHIGGLSYEAFHQMMHDAMVNIKAFEEGKTELIKNKRLL
jgi:D-3-phosphoglycerate dehydrogenase